MRKKVKKAFRSYLLSTFIENAAEKSLIGGMGCGLWHDENVEALAEQPQKQECYAKSVFRLNLWLVTSCLSTVVELQALWNHLVVEVRSESQNWLPLFLAHWTFEERILRQMVAALIKNIDSTKKQLLTTFDFLIQQEESSFESDVQEEAASSEPSPEQSALRDGCAWNPTNIERHLLEDFVVQEIKKVEAHSPESRSTASPHQVRS
ncbi:hypothetical protein L596_005958 [Steinernema carpocapsae]|uniref:Uncharacterized protein n=1 Tax=Steinernema carpocapsae TaxID=34508 RepID=A0A4V6I8M2_STECR|nr:hypothetical protein L596_005958 [Steinernema carpocapsae]